MSETVLVERDDMALPMLVKLRNVLEAKETDGTPCRDVCMLLNDAPVYLVHRYLIEIALVSGSPSVTRCSLLPLSKPTPRPHVRSLFVSCPP